MAYQIYGYDFGPFAPPPKQEAKRTGPTFGPELREPDGDGFYYVDVQWNEYSFIVKDVVMVRGYEFFIQKDNGWNVKFSVAEFSGRWWRIVPPGGAE